MSKCEVVRGHGGSSLKGGVSRTGGRRSVEGQVGEGVGCVAGWVTARVRPGEALPVGVVVTVSDHK